MNLIKFFWKQDCPKCPAAKTVFHGLKEEGFDVTEYDLDTVDGLAEGAYYNVLSTPTLLVIDAHDRELLQWRGSIPTREEIMAALMIHNVKPQITC